MIYRGRRCYHFRFARKKGKITGIAQKVAVPFCERNAMRKLTSTFIGLIMAPAVPAIVLAWLFRWPPRDFFKAVPSDTAMPGVELTQN